MKASQHSTAIIAKINAVVAKDYAQGYKTAALVEVLAPVRSASLHPTAVASSHFFSPVSLKFLSSEENVKSCVPQGSAYTMRTNKLCLPHDDFASSVTVKNSKGGHYFLPARH